MAPRDARTSSCLLIFALVLAAGAPQALASCQGNACRKQEAAAKAAGLLGGGLRASCSPLQDPKQGALLPVS